METAETQAAIDKLVEAGKAIADKLLVEFCPYCAKSFLGFLNNGRLSDQRREKLRESAHVATFQDLLRQKWMDHS
eukprot:13198649-Alexandrium_andersonii.AAC.1